MPVKVMVLERQDAKDQAVVLSGGKLMTFSQAGRGAAPSRSTLGSAVELRTTSALCHPRRGVSRLMANAYRARGEQDGQCPALYHCARRKS